MPWDAPVALVFGRERSGLTNDEIGHCTHQVSIPANPDYGILNLAQAVQVLAYEVNRAWRRRPDSGYHPTRPTGEKLPSREQLDHFHAHLGSRHAGQRLPDPAPCPYRGTASGAYSPGPSRPDANCRCCAACSAPSSQAPDRTDPKGAIEEGSIRHTSVNAMRHHSVAPYSRQASSGCLPAAHSDGWNP